MFRGKCLKALTIGRCLILGRNSHNWTYMHHSIAWQITGQPSVLYYAATILHVYLFFMFRSSTNFKKFIPWCWVKCEFVFILIHYTECRIFCCIWCNKSLNSSGLLMVYFSTTLNTSVFAPFLFPLSPRGLQLLRSGFAHKESKRLGGASQQAGLTLMVATRCLHGSIRVWDSWAVQQALVASHRLTVKWI